MLLIGDIMTSNPYTLRADNSLTDARVLMAQHRIRHIPIVDDEMQLIGLITQRDILAAQTSCLLSLSENRRIEQENEIQLGELMRTRVLTIDLHAGIRAAAQILFKHRIGCLPVTEQSKLVGIITDSDFVAVAIHLLELEEETDPPEQDELDDDSLNGLSADLPPQVRTDNGDK